MQELPKLQEMLAAALTQAAQECGTLLGQELEISDAAGKEVARDSYFKKMENASFVVGIESKEDYQGVLYLIITFRDAIVLSGTLLGVPPARIMEKKKLAIVESDDVDAFSEIANQITGSFNTVFKRSLPKKSHLKQLPPKKFIPQQDPVEANEPVDDGDYYLLQGQMSLAGKELEQFDILIPLSLAKMFDLRDRSQEEQQVQASAEEMSAEETAVADEGPAGVLILGDDAAERQQFEDMLSASGVSPVGAAHDADLKKLLAQQDFKAVLVSIANTSDHELSFCLKITANLKGMQVPIIMCAREWTRTSVLKALKYGAGDILMTPCSADELSAKVLKQVRAA
jgi:CheY-like chemotaxis protein